jgi:hypothetical protein
VTTSSELDALDPDSVTVVLSTGQEVVIESLRTRQFFKLLRIITNGAGPALIDMPLNLSLSSSEFVERFLGLILFSIPEAEDETLEFLRSMVSPKGLVLGKKLSDPEKEINQGLWDSLNTFISNPPLDDTVSILEAIIRNEAEDIQNLGKRLGAMFQVAQKTGQAPKVEKTGRKDRTASLLEGSHVPSTS